MWNHGCFFVSAAWIRLLLSIWQCFYNEVSIVLQVSLSLLNIRLKFAICSKLQVFKPKISQGYRENYFEKVEFFYFLFFWWKYDSLLWEGWFFYFEKVDGKLLSISFFPSHMIEVSYWFHVGVRGNCSTLFLLTTNWVKGDSNLDSSIRQCHEVTKFLCLFLQLNIMTIEHQFEQISNMKIGRLTSPF